MPQKEITLDARYSIDPATGYLTCSDGRTKFNAERKRLFLLRLVELEDVAEACKAVGISRRILDAHKRADKQFKKDFKATQVEIKNRPANQVVERSTAIIDNLFNKLNG